MRSGFSRRTRQDKAPQSILSTPSNFEGGDISDEDHDSDALGSSHQSQITTANGAFGYSNDWDGVASASDPALAAARLLHNARQMTDTSRWWTMRWPSNAVSLLGRAGNLTTGQTYDLLKKLWHVTVEFSEQLWQETIIRRKERTTQSWRARRCAAAVGRVQASLGFNGTQQQEQTDAFLALGVTLAIQITRNQPITRNYYDYYPGEVLPLILPNT